MRASEIKLFISVLFHVVRAALASVVSSQYTDDTDDRQTRVYGYSRTLECNCNVRLTSSSLWQTDRASDTCFTSIRNSDTSTSELNHVQTWAEENNLKLNCSKSKEIIFTGRGTRIKPVTIPPPCLNICQHR